MDEDATSAGDQLTHARMTEMAAHQLAAEGLIRIEIGEDGKETWILTDAGRDHLANLQEMGD